MSPLWKQQHNSSRQMKPLKIIFDPSDNMFRAKLSVDQIEDVLRAKFTNVPFAGKQTKLHHCLIKLGLKEQFIYLEEEMRSIPSGEYTTSLIDPIAKLSACEWVEVDQSAADALKAMETSEVNSRSTEARMSVPENVAGRVPYPYQAAGVRFILSRWEKGIGVLVGDEMGVGKTAQAVLSILMNPDIKRCLIITPKGVMKQWAEDELAIWLNTGDSRFCRPSDYSPHGWKLDETSIQVMEDTKEPIMGRVTLINFAKLSNKTSWPKIKDIKWDCIIVDEAHTLFNPETKMGKNFYSLEAKYKLALTGTPIRKKMEDVYEIVDWLTRVPHKQQSGFLGLYQDFYTNFLMAMRGREKLNKLLRTTCMIRRKKADVLKGMRPQLNSLEVREAPMEVKDKLETMRDMVSGSSFHSAKSNIERLQSKISMASGEEADILSQELEEAFQELQKSMGVKGVHISEMSALRRETGIAKIPWIIEVAEKWLEEGDPFIITFIHHQVGKSLERRFKNDCAIIIGGMSAHDRQQSLKSFRSGNKKIMLLSTLAGAEGGNMQTSHKMLMAELPWSYWRYDQVRNRIHRPGQLHPCIYHHLIFEGSLDEKMMSLFVGEDNIQKAVLK